MASYESIAAMWVDRVLRTCPDSSCLAAVDDPFRNPVGHTIRTSLAILLEELCLGMNRDHMRQALDPLLQIRAVQDIPPSRALEFLFQLKDILRLHAPGEDQGSLGGRIDEVALMAFDIYLAYRERTYQVRANEARRRVYVLEERLGPKARAAWHERAET